MISKSNRSTGYNPYYLEIKIVDGTYLKGEKKTILNQTQYVES